MPQAARTATVVSAAAAMAAAAAAAAAAAVVWFVALCVRGRGRHFATSARVSGFDCRPGIGAMQRAGRAAAARAWPFLRKLSNIRKNDLQARKTNFKTAAVRLRQPQLRRALTRA